MIIYPHHSKICLSGSCDAWLLDLNWLRFLILLVFIGSADFNRLIANGVAEQSKDQLEPFRHCLFGSSIFSAWIHIYLFYFKEVCWFLLYKISHCLWTTLTLRNKEKYIGAHKNISFNCNQITPSLSRFVQRWWRDIQKDQNKTKFIK